MALTEGRGGGGRGCGKAGFCRCGEAWLRAAPRMGGEERREGGSGRPRAAEAGQGTSPDAKSAVATMKIADGKASLLPLPFEGEQVPGVVAGEEQVGPPMLAEDTRDGDLPCSVSRKRAARFVAKRVLPRGKGAQPPVAAEAGTAPVPWKKRRVARKTSPVNIGPLKKAMAEGGRKSHDQEEYPEEAEGRGDRVYGDLAASTVAPFFRSVDAYEILSKVGEGAYGVVYKARERKTGEIVALKKMDLDLSTAREITILASLRRHPYVVGLKEIAYNDTGGREDCVFLVMEYAEFDLRRVIEEMRRPLSQGEVKFLMRQLLLGIQWIHDSGVLHRDLKTSNVLITRRGELKVCDFGLSRRCIGGIGERRPYTDWVVTLWYRAPELLLKDNKGYSAAIDVWSAGCIMAEMLGEAPLFRGKNELDQLHQIFGVLGTPDERTWPDFAALCAEMKVGFTCRQPRRGDSLREKMPPSCLSEAGYDLLTGLLAYDPSKRMTAKQALGHEWFREDPPPTKLCFAGEGVC